MSPKRIFAAESSVHQVPCDTVTLDADDFLLLELEVGLGLEAAVPEELSEVVIWPVISGGGNNSGVRRVPRCRVKEELTLLKRGQGVVRLHIWMRYIQADTNGGQILAQRRAKVSAVAKPFWSRGMKRTEKDDLSCG